MEQHEDRIKLILDELGDIWRRNPDKSFIGVLYQCGIISSKSYISDAEVMRQLGVHNSTKERLKHELSNSD